MTGVMAMPDTSRLCRFKPGDRVVIRDWDDMANEYGVETFDGFQSINITTASCYFTEGMLDLCGTSHIVTQIYQRRRSFGIRISGNDDWTFVEEMFLFPDEYEMQSDSLPEVSAAALMEILMK